MRHFLYRISIICLLSIVHFNCNNQTAVSTATNVDSSSKEKSSNPPSPLVFEKMLGTWQSENGKNFERWKKIADGT